MKADQRVKQPFEAVVAQHGATVLRVVRAVVGHADADDAWSDTFLAALKAYPQLPADANIEAWLVTIAHRKAIDITRAASRRAVPVADPPTPPHLTAPTASISMISTWTPRWSRCHPNSARPWPTTTWRACPTPRSPRSSTAASPPPGAPRPTASPPCEHPTHLSRIAHTKESS